MKKKNLLIISSGYPNESGEYLAHTFVKGFVEEAKNEYKEVIVFVLLPYIPGFLKKFSNQYHKPLEDYSYDNVKVKYNNYAYLPVWPFNRSKGKIAYNFLKSEIEEYIDDNTVIHANFSSPAGVFADHLCKDKDKSFVLTVHEDHDWLMDELESRNKHLISTWKNAKALIRVNKLDIELLRPYNENLFTIPNGYNHRRFKKLDSQTCRKELQIEDGTRVMVNIGFYKPQKNQKLLINAINHLPENLKSGLKCFIIGGGPLEKELRDQISDLQLNEYISIEGQIPQNKLPVYLNAADLFCLSSDSEGNPTVMFEALGVGLPYVGTNVGGVPEIITSEEYGLISEPGNIEELSRNIQAGLEKDWDRNEILSYSSQYTWQNIFLRTKELY